MLPLQLFMDLAEPMALLSSQQKLERKVKVFKSMQQLSTVCSALQNKLIYSVDHSLQPLSTKWYLARITISAYSRIPIGRMKYLRTGLPFKTIKPQLALLPISIVSISEQASLNNQAL